MQMEDATARSEHAIATLRDERDLLHGAARGGGEQGPGCTTGRVPQAAGGRGAVIESVAGPKLRRPIGETQAQTPTGGVGWGGLGLKILACPYLFSCPYLFMVRPRRQPAERWGGARSQRLSRTGPRGAKKRQKVGSFSVSHLAL